MKSKVLTNMTQRLGPRKEQQDRLVSLDIPKARCKVKAVLDGMGGSEEGGYAAEIARIAVLDTFCELIYSPYLLAPWHIAFSCAIKANNRVLAFGKTLNLPPKAILPGSTALIAVIHESGKVGICWLGDSLAAAWDGTRLETLTEPHNANTDPAYKNQNPNSSGGNGLTRYLGEDIYGYEPQIIGWDAKPNTSLLLMSDGAFHVLFSDEGRAQMKSKSASQILESADEKELTDNASLIEIAFMPETESEPCKNYSGNTPSSTI